MTVPCLLLPKKRKKYHCHEKITILSFTQLHTCIVFNYHHTLQLG